MFFFGVAEREVGKKGSLICTSKGFATFENNFHILKSYATQKFTLSVRLCPLRSEEMGLVSHSILMDIVILVKNVIIW